MIYGSGETLIGWQSGIEGWVEYEEKNYIQDFVKRFKREETDGLLCHCGSSIFQSVEEIKPLSLSRERDCWEWQWLFRDVDDADGGANISNGTFPGENDVQGKVESLGSKITFSFVVLSFASSFVLRLLSCVDIWQLIKTDLFHSGSPSDWWWSLGGHRRVGGGGALGGVTS